MQLQPTNEAVLNPGDPGVTELSGLVTSGNDPLPGVTVQLRSEDSTFTTGTTYREVLTGSDGTYTILTERTDNVVLMAFAPTTDFSTTAKSTTFSLAPGATGPRFLNFNFPKRLVLIEEPPSVGATALPRVTWEAVAGATSYSVWLWGPRVPGVVTPLVIQTEIEGTTIEPAAPVPDGPYEYLVRASDGTTVLAEADVFFTVGAP